MRGALAGPGDEARIIDAASRWRVPQSQLLFTHKPVWSGSLATAAAAAAAAERGQARPGLPVVGTGRGRWEIVDE